jgi:hypothetical protein
MPTPFSFEHRFRAAAPASVFAIYFDAEHRDEQDRRVEVARRDILEDVDTPSERRRTSRVFPRRQLPAIVRAFVKGDLSYDETVVWTKAADRIDFDIQPRILNGRAHIVATYTLRPGGAGEVIRTYQGTVTVDARLIGTRVEKAIIEDLGRSLATSAACTQEFLDRAAAAEGGKGANGGNSGNGGNGGNGGKVKAP